MSTTFEIKDNDVPEGNFTAHFVGYEKVSHEEYGDGLRWEFQICEGKYKGRSAFRTTSPTPTTKNACGAIVAAIGGASQSDGVSVNPDGYIGKEYLIIVKKSPSGKGTRVHELILKDGDTPF